MARAETIDEMHGTSDHHEVQYVVTLIHGTHARNADWYQSDSQFSKALAVGLPGVLLHPFSWSGNNSPSARDVAASTLAEDLIHLVAAYPYAKHYIVAHSHGGNIALYALRDITLQSRIAGVICLSTPFLYVQPRNLGESGFELVSKFSSLMGFFFMLTGAATLYFKVIPKPTLFQTFIASIALIIFGIFSINTLTLIQRWITERFSQRLSQILRKMELPPRINTPFLIFRTTGDEASSLLTFSQFLSWIIIKLWTFVLVPQLLWSKWLKRQNFRRDHPIFLVFILFILALLASCLAVFGKQVPYPYTDIVRYLPALLIAAGIALYVAALIMMITIVVILLIISFIPLGYELALSHALLEVSIESAPPGPHFLYQSSYQEALKTKVKALLNHSLSYQDPYTIAVILDWMKGSCTLRVSPSLLYDQDNQSLKSEGFPIN